MFLVTTSISYSQENKTVCYLLGMVSISETSPCKQVCNMNVRRKYTNFKI